MSRYFSDAVNLLGLLIILVIVLCSYLDVNTVHELLKKTIEELPFGSYVITIYEIKISFYCKKYCWNYSIYTFEH